MRICAKRADFRIPRGGTRRDRPGWTEPEVGNEISKAYPPSRTSGRLGRDMRPSAALNCDRWGSEDMLVVGKEQRRDDLARRATRNPPLNINPILYSTVGMAKRGSGHLRISETDAKSRIKIKAHSSCCMTAIPIEGSA